MGKNAAIAGLAAVSGLAAGTACLISEAYKLMFCRESSPLGKLFPISHHDPDYYAYKAQVREKMKDRPVLRYAIASVTGETVYGFYYCCGDRPCGRIAFVLHGFRSDHMESAAQLMDYYFSRGFDVFGYDYVAHGESTGRFIGYDYFESKDGLAWIEKLKSLFGPDIVIILHGFSMGGATACRMSNKVPENVKFIIDDSGYINAGKTLRSTAGPLYLPTRLIQKIKAGYDVEYDTDCRGCVAEAKCPMLFVHGESDPLVPFDHGVTLYETCSGPKEALFLPDCRHIEAWYLYRDKYARRIDALIQKYCN